MNRRQLLRVCPQALDDGRGGLAYSSVGGSSGVFNNSNTGQGQLADLFYSVGNPGIGSAITAGGCISGWFLPIASSVQALVRAGANVIPFRKAA